MSSHFMTASFFKNARPDGSFLPFGSGVEEGQCETMNDEAYSMLPTFKGKMVLSLYNSWALHGIIGVYYKECFSWGYRLL